MLGVCLEGVQLGGGAPMVSSDGVKLPRMAGKWLILCCAHTSQQRRGLAHAGGDGSQDL